MDTSKKGNSTFDLVIFLKMLREGIGALRSVQYELDKEFQSNPSWIKETCTPPYTWASIYERPFLEHLAIFTEASGLQTTFTKLAQSEDPIQQASNLLKNAESAEYQASEEGNYEVKDMVGLHHALIRSMDCLMIYDWYLDELVEKTGNGDDEALFKALSVDRALVGCPTVAHRFALAELQNDQAFFIKAAKAIQKGPNEKNTQYMDLRYLLPFLDQQGILEKLSQEEECQLFVEELRVYPASDDGGKSLHQFIYRWRQKRHST